MTRRQFFRRAPQGIGIGIPALASLLDPMALAATPSRTDPKTGGLAGLSRISRPKPSASSICTNPGAPSQIDLFDYKPKLAKIAGTELPDSIRKGQRITGMTSGQILVAGGAVDFQVRAVRASPAPGSANCCRTPRRSWTTSPSSRP